MKIERTETRQNEAVMNLLRLVRDLKGKSAASGPRDHQRRRAKVQAVLATLLQASKARRY